VNKTQQLAKQAVDKAMNMGWEVYVCYDQSDGIDYATVIAWAPGSTRARYITFIDEMEGSKGWRSVDRFDTFLRFHNVL